MDELWAAIDRYLARHRELAAIGRAQDSGLEARRMALELGRTSDAEYVAERLVDMTRRELQLRAEEAADGAPPRERGRR